MRKILLQKGNFFSYVNFIYIRDITMGLFNDYNVSLSRFMYGDNSQNADNKNTSFVFYNFNKLNCFTCDPFINGTFSFNMNFTPYYMPIFNVFDYKFQTPPLVNPLSSTPKLTNLSYLPMDTFEMSSANKVSKASATLSSKNIANNSSIDLSWWKAQGYNEEKGKKLAAQTKKYSDYLYRKGIKSQCGKGVRHGVNEAFYNGVVHHKPQNLDAKVFGDKYFAYDDNLKKINVKGLKLTKYDIPEGAIVIYEKYSKNPAGHIEVSDGNGHGYSNLKTTLLQNHGQYKQPKEIWIPV